MYGSQRFLDELVEHFVNCILSVQYVVCVLVFTVLLDSFMRILSLQPFGRITVLGLLIVEKDSSLLISYPRLVCVNGRLSSRNSVPTSEYYTLGRVFDKDPFRLNPILSIGLFQRRLAALKSILRCGVYVSRAHRWGGTGGG